ncbi:MULTISPECIES: C40 family peptidase [Bradyrhizobium]|jgi:cell wall-associated NlpC family hydrolase|uniref:C40 family peptidase n=1 Tax=Bradyrhizobium TaxID=374 RepID=UPI0004833E14|nr:MULTISPECIES: NlpC/P60 family protein [Bradyrhizobium]MCS3453253.1 cell wall-associated NlpC family hydrolase [Bradyrhizobium elkanii]MCS3564639.1 cell wall-associated NlpC family hydrolase [Bradyrhizobium elkanii]MCW2145529.1 cell wall-associated NlpC family hydrolase [Bradyrhizobium elkanii]MCW2355653.1 cell wall-associated NlpC family hydrolase [Bradyrhizobium elkanii]MCW2378356.1 cell wall-associated NlpC family hydrolase [Bradyrhizobium elkanii]
MHDPRLTPARDDLAAKYLEGKVKAARFVEGEAFEVFDAIAPLRQAPASDAEQMTQALRGERITVYDRNGEGWAWGQLADDGYVGWIPEAALTTPGAAPTHKVAALRTLAFPGPSIKLPPVEALAMGTKLAIIREDGAFALTREGWHLPRQHLAPLDTMAGDFVAIAEQFVGTPYLWGGKSSLGIDCSGLVQIALTAAGTGCPRDSDMQQEGLGGELTAVESKQLQRGDLIFWKGHVAIVRDATTIVHANAHHMTTALENTHAAIARIKAAGSEVLAIKRL